MNAQQNRWMMDLGQVQIPKSWSEQREIRIEEDDGRKKIVHTKKLDSYKMVKKLRRGIVALLKNPYVETRAEVYEILKERNFLPIIAGYKLMSWQRFAFYYSEARLIPGLKKYKPTKIDFIKDHYKKWSQEAIADHLECKVIYVQQTISKIKRGLIK